MSSEAENPAISPSLSSETKKKGRLPDWAWLCIISVAVFLFIFLSFLFLRPLGAYEDSKNRGLFAKLFGLVLFLGLTGALIILRWKKGHFSLQQKIAFAMGYALIIHVVYMLYTGPQTRQHDMSYPSAEELAAGKYGDGHFAYAMSFYLHMSMPEVTSPAAVYQFYHPPLNAFIQGLFMRIFEGLNPFAYNESDAIVLYGSTAILSCFYMYLTGLFFVKAILLTDLSPNGKFIASLFVLLFPRLTQLSGQLNNDSLALMFSAVTLYFFLKWYLRGYSWRDMLLAGLFTGLSMFAKMSAAVICLGMAVGFLVALIKVIVKKEDSLRLKAVIFQYLAFLAIAAPIGLWFQAYSHYVYGLPWNYVFDNLNSSLFNGTRDYVLSHHPDRITSFDRNNSGLAYTSGFYNFLIRFVSPFHFEDFLNSTRLFPYCSPFSDYNLSVYALRSAIFGEFPYWYGLAEAFGVIAFFANFFLYYGVIIYLVYCFLEFLRKKQPLGKEGMMFFYLLIGVVVMFVYLQIKMPYGCSMDFRYIVPIILPFGYFIAHANDKLKGGAFPPALKYGILGCGAVFLASSYCFYFAAI